MHLESLEEAKRENFEIRKALLAANRPFEILFPEYVPVGTANEEIFSEDPETSYDFSEVEWVSPVEDWEAYQSLIEQVEERQETTVEATEPDTPDDVFGELEWL